MKPAEAKEDDIQGHHSRCGDEEVGCPGNLQCIHGNDRQRLHGGTCPRQAARKNPKTQEDLPRANRHGGDSGKVLAQDPRDDHTVPRDAIKELAVKPVENPDGADEDPQEEVEPVLDQWSDAAKPSYAS